MRRGLDLPIIYSYLCFEMFKNYEDFESYRHLPNPYEIVIKILIRGNHISRGEMRTIEIDNIPIFKDIDFSKDYLPSFENDFLDFIDNECARIGSMGIPNPEKTLELYNKFRDREM